MKCKLVVGLMALCLTAMSIHAMAAERVVSTSNEFGGKTIESAFPGKKCTEYYNKNNILMKKICISECGTTPNKKVTEYHNENGVRAKADVYLCPNFFYGSGTKRVNREVLSFDAKGARWTTKDTYYDDKFVGKVFNK